MIKYYLKHPDRVLERKTVGAAGFDLIADLREKYVVMFGDRIVDGTLIIDPGQRVSIPTGLYLEMPLGVEGQIRSRSGLARDHGIVVAQGVGTVDSDYRGEVCVTLVNTDWKNQYTLQDGDRIAQLVFARVIVTGDLDLQHSLPRWVGPGMPIMRVPTLEDLSTTERGSGGHGSTGR